MHAAQFLSLGMSEVLTIKREQNMIVQKQLAGCVYMRQQASYKHPPYYYVQSFEQKECTILNHAAMLTVNGTDWPAYVLRCSRQVLCGSQPGGVVWEAGLNVITSVQRLHCNYITAKLFKFTLFLFPIPMNDPLISMLLLAVRPHFLLLRSGVV